MPSFLPEYARASQINQSKMPNIAHFSDQFREVIHGSNYELSRKGYASGQVELIEAARENMAALCKKDTYDSPTKVLNYVECHDNQTLWDKNLICCFQESEKIRKKRQILTNAMVLLAQGIPFIHAGQEFGRTKRGIGNSYNKPDTINKMDYHLKDRNKWMVEEFKQLVKIRKEHSCFRMDNAKDIKDKVNFDVYQNQMLVYDCFGKEDHCMAFFNPTSNEFEYKFNESVKILFDNGELNEEKTSSIRIAPYSVIVVNI
ncbi:MAG: hypothetical protein HUJ53_08955 [Holdemanella sp.]|nr:hypothetical protein [Holdemanella sp.]